MTLTTATKRLKKEGFEITSSTGSFVATKGEKVITFFENGLGSNRCSKFTDSSKNLCSPIYSLSLKQAMN